MLTLEKFEEAIRNRKTGHTPETKLVYSQIISVTRRGNKVYLKPENMQLTGAYKLQGRLLYHQYLVRRKRIKGWLPHLRKPCPGSCLCGKAFGVKATIVMPTTTPLIKVNRTKSYGAEVVLYGDVYDEACAYATRTGGRTRLHLLHPFDDLSGYRTGDHCHGDRTGLPRWTISWSQWAAADFSIRCSHPCKDAESEYKSHRCGAGVGQLTAAGLKANGKWSELGVPIPSQTAQR